VGLRIQFSGRAFAYYSQGSGFDPQHQRRKKSRKQHVLQGCKEVEPCVLWVTMHNSADPMANRMTVLRELKTQLQYDPSFSRLWWCWGLNLGLCSC
jgi:hypothetical protein